MISIEIQVKRMSSVDERLRLVCSGWGNTDHVAAFDPDVGMSCRELRQRVETRRSAVIPRKYDNGRNLDHIAEPGNRPVWSFKLDVAEVGVHSHWDQPIGTASGPRS